MQNGRLQSLKNTGYKFRLAVLLALFVGFTSFILYYKDKPTLYLIGDSTVRNGDGSGRNGQWGWGSFIANYFDTNRISVQNHAMGGRSSRTFITEGRWEAIVAKLKKGDYVMMQFGHNDSSPLDDTARARGTIKGTGAESKDIYNPITKKQETVYSFGWYMRKYIHDVKAAGAVPIVCSPIPRNDWDGDKVKRGNESYGKWAKDVAEAEGAYFIDLNNLVADRYDNMNKEKVAALFYGDHTHTSEAGARINAEIIIKKIKTLKGLHLKTYLKPMYKKGKMAKEGKRKRSQGL